MKPASLANACFIICAASLVVPARAQTPTPVPTPSVPASPFDQPAVATRPANPPPQLVLRVYQLRHAEASDAAKLIERIVADVRGTPLRVVADTRTNTLIISAPQEVHKRVEDLVKILDVPGDKPVERIVKVYQLKYARADVLLQTLQQTLALPNGRPTLSIACDPSTNALLVCGNPADLNAVEQSITQLDRPIAPNAQRGGKIRIVWLVSDMDLPTPPADMKDVIDELDSLGVKNLRLVTQNMIQTISGEEFSIQCTPPGFLNCRVRIQGKFEENETSAPRLRLSLNAVGKVPSQEPPTPSTPQPVPPSSSNELASLMTTVFAPTGHKVVLGVTPIDKYTSVFVIQVLANEPVK